MKNDQTQSPDRTTERALRGIVLAGPLWYSVVVAYITLTRYTYPFDLEWMEGGSLLHLLRLQAGKPLYVAPSLEFTPYIYPPLYYYLAFGLSKLTGLTWFTPLRLTSLLASLGCAILIFLIVRKQAKSTYWGLLSAGLFVATFRAGGAWFDIARVDMLFVFLMLASLYALVAARHWTTELISGLLFALAFYTKQTSIALLLGCLLMLLLLRGWRSALRLGLSFALLTGLIVGLESILSQGWYGYYIFQLPRTHQLVDEFWGQLLVQVINIAGPLAVALPIGLAGAAALLRQHWQSDATLTIAASLNLALIAVIAGLNKGAYDNAYVPAFAGFAILFGLGGDRMLNSLQGLQRRKFRLPLYTLCLLQFALLFFNVSAQIPTRQDREAGEKLVATLQSARGDVLIPYHSYMAALAGKPVYAHHIALLEIRGAFGETQDTAWAAIENDINAAIRDKRFELIVLEHKHSLWQVVFDNYIPTPIDYPSPATFLPVTGAETRPETIWRPQP